MELCPWTRRRIGVATVLLATSALPAQLTAAAVASPAGITQERFGEHANVPVERYTLRNRHGMQARITTYGGIVTDLTAPDRNGRFADVVLGYDTLDEYLKSSTYFGALIGRYGNRIAKGQFTLDETRYQLATNNGPNALHGGVVGFDKVVWKATESVLSTDGPRLTLTYLSRDGEEGYPGNLSVTAVYTLTDDNALRLDYTAQTDKKTVVNLTQHSYFNLRGRGDVLGHVVQIAAERFTPVDNTLIPTGQLQSVAGTPFDFRKATTIGSRIDADYEQLRFGKGYDHNWVIGKAGKLRVLATVHEPDSGRVLEVLSAAPGLQFYTGNFLDGSLTGKNGWVYKFRNGFCMEPQYFPDSPNQLSFPSATLNPGEIYQNTIVYRFSAR